MAFLDKLKKKDGSWNVGLIMALVVAVLAIAGAAFGVYYSYGMAARQQMAAAQGQKKIIDNTGRTKLQGPTAPLYSDTYMPWDWFSVPSVESSNITFAEPVSSDGPPRVSSFVPANARDPWKRANPGAPHFKNYKP